MEGKETLEQRTPLLQGDKIFRVRRRSPRITPDIPPVFRFRKQIARETPFIPLLIALNGGNAGRLQVEYDTAWSKKLSTDEPEVL